MVTWLSIPAVVVVAFLGWNLYRRFGADRIRVLDEKRSPTANDVAARWHMMLLPRHAVGKPVVAAATARELAAQMAGAL
jgi:hypothetical protein